MRVWGPVVAIVFAVVLAVVTGAGLDTTDGVLVEGVMLGAGVASVFWGLSLLIYVAVTQMARRDDMREYADEGGTAIVELGGVGYSCLQERALKNRALPPSTVSEV